MSTQPHIPELLAPAGGPDALRAAVANGADAVYLGLDRLNARRGAENFTIDTLPEACDFAHLRDCRVYLTANVLLLPREVPEALNLIAEAWSAGVDAVIVQDLGLLRALRESLPQVRIHSSTQMNVHSSDSIVALAKRGVSRVTLSREVSIQQITELAEAGRSMGIEVESFVHGALCVCYSGQCLLSSLIGGRSANRGMCAQPCRLAYELVDEADREFDTPGAHLLSPKDLAGVSALPALIETGAAALKIEGRMKSAEYVALVTGVYRAALDRASSAPESYEVRQGERSVLSEAFSRGFTEAYLTGARGNEMMSYRRPNNRGVPVARISSVEGSAKATISFDVPVDAEDIIEVWTSRGRFAQPVGVLRYAGAEHPSVPAGVKATVVLSEPAGAGDRVFRVRNAALSAAAARTFSGSDAAPIPLNFTVRVTESQLLRVDVSDQKGRTGGASGPMVERARTKAVTAEEIAEHVGRLGGTPYTAASWDIELSHGVGIGFSALHRVRREALASYEAGVLSRWSRPSPAAPRLPGLPGAASRPALPKLVACVSSREAAMYCFDAGADEVQVPIELLTGEEDARVSALLPRISHDGRTVVADLPQRLVAGTVGQLHDAASSGACVESHWSLNAMNGYAVAELATLGASLVWLSPELSGEQLADVVKVSSVHVGIGVAGRQELMVTEHCILMAEGDCSRNCSVCERRRAPRWLRDRKGYRFPVTTDTGGRSHVYNSVTLDLAPLLPQLADMGVAAVRADLQLDDAGAAAREVARLRTALDGMTAGITPEKRKDIPTTSGHYFRGVS